MSGGPGFILAEWSDVHSSWCSLAVWPKAKRADVLALAGRLVLSNPRDLTLVPVVDLDDEDEEEAVLSKLKPPRGAFVAHGVGDVNA